MKTYRGTSPDGSPWEKMKCWFGFKLHLLVDSVHELPVNYQVTKASADETTRLLPLVRDTEAKHPGLISEICEELSADKGYDSTANVAGVWDEHGVKPVIDCRELKKDGEGCGPWPTGVSRPSAGP